MIGGKVNTISQFHHTIGKLWHLLMKAAVPTYRHFPKMSAFAPSLSKAFPIECIN